MPTKVSISSKTSAKRQEYTDDMIFGIHANIAEKQTPQQRIEAELRNIRVLGERIQRRTEEQRRVNEEMRREEEVLKGKLARVQANIAVPTEVLEHYDENIRISALATDYNRAPAQSNNVLCDDRHHAVVQSAQVPVRPKAKYSRESDDRLYLNDATISRNYIPGGTPVRSRSRGGGSYHQGGGESPSRRVAPKTPTGNAPNHLGWYACKREGRLFGGNGSGGPPSIGEGGNRGSSCRDDPGGSRGPSELRGGSGRQRSYDVPKRPAGSLALPDSSSDEEVEHGGDENANRRRSRAAASSSLPIAFCDHATLNERAPRDFRDNSLNQNCSDAASVAYKPPGYYAPQSSSSIPYHGLVRRAVQTDDMRANCKQNLSDAATIAHKQAGCFAPHSSCPAPYHGSVRVPIQSICKKHGLYIAAHRPHSCHSCIATPPYI
jgi:hypothetical protein